MAVGSLTTWHEQTLNLAQDSYDRGNEYIIAQLLHLIVNVALQVHGSAAIAELLGLPVPKRGRRSEVRN